MNTYINTHNKVIELILKIYIVSKKHIYLISDSNVIGYTNIPISVSVFDIVGFRCG